MKAFNLRKTMLCLSLVVATTLGTVQNSHAIVAAASWTPSMMGTGFLIFSGSLVPGSLGMGAGWLGQQALGKRNLLGKIGGGIGYAVGAVLIGGAIAMSFYGFGMLPDGTQALELSPIDSAGQKRLGLTSADVSSFNAELEQVNVILREVSSSLNQMEKPTAENVAEEFSKFDGLLSEGTLMVLEKLSLEMASL